MVEVIKVIDLTDVPIHMKEILFAKVLGINAAEKLEVFQIAQVFHVEQIGRRKRQRAAGM